MGDRRIGKAVPGVGRAEGNRTLQAGNGRHCRTPVAGKDQGERNEGGHSQDGERWAKNPSAERERSKPEIHEKAPGGQCDEKSGETHCGPCLGNEDREVFHDAGKSLALTLFLALPLGICAAGPGTAGWEHIAVSAGFYCVLFGLCSWATGHWGAEKDPVHRTVFMESRLAIGTIGIAAIGFRSPALLGVAPDILAVGIAMAGYADGIAVGLVAHRCGCSRLRAFAAVCLHRGGGREEPS